MFTTGSKLFFGLSALGLAAFVVNALQTSWSPMASMTLAAFVIATAFLGFVIIAFRDAEAPVVARLATSAADAEGRATVGTRVPNSPWPILGGFGVAAVAVGIVVDELLFWLGVIVLVAVFVEWMVQAWAERASADPAYNAELRNRTMNPFEFPVAGLLLGGVVIVSFSRVMLALEADAAVVAFSVLSAVVFVGALILSARPAVRGTLLTGIVLVFGVGLIAAGIAAAAAGPHEPEKFEEAGTTASVSNTTGLAATIALVDGRLEVQPNDKPVSEESVFRVPRATIVNLLFRNEGDEDAVFVVVTRALNDSGEFVETEVKTGPLGEGDEQSLAVEFPAAGEYEIFVEGGPASATATVEVA